MRMSDETKDTFNSVLSANDFSKKLGVNLSNMEDIAKTIKGALNNGQIKNIGDVSSLISTETLMKLVQDQTNLMTCTLASLGGSSVLDQSSLQSTIGTALSAVMGTMTCSLANMQSNIAKMSELTQQIEKIKSSIQNSDIDGLKSTVK
jgi:HPt (histidine-containing phosphotransfer) domain-containing protein